MRTYFSCWQATTANVTERLPYVTLHPVRLSIGTLQNRPSCFQTSRLKGITSIHRQRPLQKHVNNHTDNVNSILFATVPFTLANMRWRYAPAQGDQR